MKGGGGASLLQDNHSRSIKNTLRGLNHQMKLAQGKLVQVARDELFDGAIDLRANSPTIGSDASLLSLSEIADPQIEH